MKKRIKKFGKDLAVGDVIAPWGGSTARIVAFKPLPEREKHWYGPRSRIMVIEPYGPNPFGTCRREHTADGWQTYDVEVEEETA